MLQNCNTFDLGPSLLDEMDLMFRSMSSSGGETIQFNHNSTLNFDSVNKHNDLAEMNSKVGRKPSGTLGSGSGSDMPICELSFLWISFEMSTEMTCRSSIKLPRS